MAVNTFTGAIDSNWGTAGNWSLGTVPTISDGHTATFDAASPACTINGSAKSCQRLDMSAYVNTLTMTYNLNTNGNITFGSGMTISDAGTLTSQNNAQITTNGFVFPNSVSFLQGAATVTLVDDFTIQGNLNIGTSTANLTINGNNIYLEGDFNATANRLILGTTVLNFVGNNDATFYSFSTIRNSITFNKGAAATLTLGTYVQYQGPGVLTYTAGIIDCVTNNNQLLIGSSLSVGGSPIFNTNGMLWNKISIGNTVVTYGCTLLSNLQCVSFYVNCYQLTLSGAFNLECDNFEVMYGPNNGYGLKLVAGQTYTVNQSFKSWGSEVLPTKILTTTPGSKAYIIFNGTNQGITNCNFTDIDASGGNKIWTLRGVVTNSVNVGVSTSSIVPITVSSIS